MNNVIRSGHGPWRTTARSTIMSQSSYAVFKGFVFIARLAACRRRSLTFRLSFKLIEIIRQQDLTSRRAYFHVHVAPGQKLLCVLQGFRSVGMTNINVRKLIAPADQEFQLRGASHARGRSQGRRARAAPAPVVRSIRSDETGTSRAPLSLRRKSSS